MKDWNLLKDKDIIDLIIGDKVVVSDLICEYPMPRMSGKDICEFGNKLGLKIEYNVEKISRWQYMERVLQYAIDNDIINQFFKDLFELKRFKYIENIEYHSSISILYWDLLHGLMNRINEVLFYDKCRIEYNPNTWSFALIDTEENIEIECENIEETNNDYIKRLRREIYDAINTDNYESCITKSRTLVEEIIIHGIEQKGIVTSAKGDIIKLYNQFKPLYDMQQKKGLDDRINGLLSGLETTINAISCIRNNHSDSHGVGKGRIMVERHHAILMANASITVSEFLLSIINKTAT